MDHVGGALALPPIDRPVIGQTGCLLLVLPLLRLSHKLLWLLPTYDALVLLQLPCTSSASCATLRRRALCCYITAAHARDIHNSVPYPGPR